MKSDLLIGPLLFVFTFVPIVFVGYWVAEWLYQQGSQLAVIFVVLCATVFGVYPATVLIVHRCQKRYDTGNVSFLTTVSVPAQAWWRAANVPVLFVLLLFLVVNGPNYIVGPAWAAGGPPLVVEAMPLTMLAGIVALAFFCWTAIPIAVADDHPLQYVVMASARYSLAYTKLVAKMILLFLFLPVALFIALLAVQIKIILPIDYIYLCYNWQTVFETLVVLINTLILGVIFTVYCHASVATYRAMTGRPIS